MTTPLPGTGVKCPYCLTSIDAKADVCPACTREIRRLLDVQSRVRELETLGAPAVAAPPHSPLANITLLVFYAGTAALVWYAVQPGSDTKSVYKQLFAMSVACGSLFTMTSRSCDIGRLFAIGFAQPLLSLVGLILVGSATIDQLADSTFKTFTLSLFQLALQVGAAVAAGGIATAVVSRVNASWQLAFQWVSMTPAGLERLEKIVLRVAAVATPLITLWSLFKKS